MKLSPTLRLHFIVLLWGFTGIIGKLISADALPLVWYRVLIGSLAILGFVVYRKHMLKVSPKNLLILLGIGTLIGLHWFFFFESIKQSNVSIALTTLSTCALFTSFIEPLILKRKLDYKEIFVGLIVVVCFAFLFKIESKYTYGIILGLFCSFFSGLFSVLNSKFFNKNTVTSSVMMFYELIGALLIITLIMGFEGSYTSLEISTHDLFWLLALGIVFTAFPMIESVSLMKYISPYTMVLSVNLEPVYGMILAYFIWKDGSETMTSQFYIIVVILIGSIVLNALLKKKKRTDLI